MLKSILKAVVDRFERRYDYDASYLRELVDIDPAAFFAFSKVQGFSGYRKAPHDLVADRAELQGPGECLRPVDGYRPDRKPHAYVADPLLGR